MRVTAIINQKGGVGKTTTALALSAGLLSAGKRVLAVDTDPQGNLSFAMGGAADAPTLSMVMRGEISCLDALQHTNQGDLLSSSLDLAGADMEFTQTGREFLLREALEILPSNYDHVIIDCPPSLGIMSINALTAASDVIIPVCADIFSLQALQQLLQNIQRVRKYANPSLRVAGLLVTRKGNRAVATRQMLEVLSGEAARLGLHCFHTQIREGVAVREAQITRQSLLVSSPRANVTMDYQRLAQEFLDQETEGEDWNDR